MKTAYLSILIILSLVFNSYSQDSLRTSSTVITYTKVGSKRSKTPIEETKKNLFKIDPLAVIVGEIPLFYERMISPKFSFELLAGITHADYAFDLINPSLTENTGERSPLFGYTLGTAIKFYPSDDAYALEGPYFGLEFRYKRFNTELINTCNPQTNSISRFPESRKVFDGKLIGGYIWHPGDNFIVETYAGVGIRTINIDGYACDGSGPIDIFVQREIERQKLALTFGIRLGFIF
jgi:hypothetical protein